MELPNGTQVIFSGNEVKIITTNGVVLYIDSKSDEISVHTTIDQVLVPYGDNCSVATNRVIKE